MNTALMVTDAPDRTLAALPAGRIASALSFAICVEALSVASIASVLFFGLSIAFPAWAAATLWTARGIGTTLASTLGFAALLVALHAVWALSIECYLGLVAKRWQFRRSLRFSLYACGWDLWASPLGLVLGLRRLGRARTLRLCEAAVRTTPHAALTSYLTETRALPPEWKKRALWSSMLLSAPLLVVGVLAWLGGTLWGLLG